MKKIFALIFALLAAPAFAEDCPSGQVTVDSADYVVVDDSTACPSSHPDEIIDPDIYPNLCDSTRGTCTQTCQPPTCD